MVKNNIAIVLSGVTFVVLLLLVFFVLPDRIPLNFSMSGEGRLHVSKYFILLLTPAPYLLYNKFTNKSK